MKKLNILSFVLIIIMALSMLISCGDNGGKEMDADSFAESLDLYGDNLKIRMTESYTGDKFTAEIIVTGGETFFSSMHDSYWYVSVGEQYLNILASAGRSFSSFEYSGGKYTADSFVYTEDGYEYEILNVEIDFDSKGRVSSFCYEVYEEDGNRVFELKMSDYGNAKAPDEELVVRDDGTTEGPSNPDGPGSANRPEENPDIDPGAGNNPDEGEQGIGEKAWMDAFNIHDTNLTARIHADSPDGVHETRILLVDGVTYCYDEEEGWLVGTLQDLLGNFSFLTDRYSEFELKGDSYYCEKSGVNIGEDASLEEITVRFDGEGRLIYISYTLVLRGERGVCSIEFGGFGDTVAPEVSGGIDNGEGGNMSKDEYTPNAPDADQNNASNGDASDNNLAG